MSAAFRPGDQFDAPKLTRISSSPLVRVTGLTSLSLEAVDRHRQGAFGRRRDDRDEFVAAEPGDNVHDPDRGLHAGGDVLQHLIPGGVSQAIVDP